MKRRLFLSGAVTAAVGLSGCSGEDSEPTATPAETTGSQPTELALTTVLETHWETYRDNDVEGHAATFHADSPKRDEEPWNSDDYWGEEDSEFIIENRDVVEMGETNATVHETVRGEHNGNTSRWRSIVELRTEGGEWKVWDFREEQIESDS